MPGRYSHKSPRVVERRQLVAARYLRGEYQSQIAQDLGLTQAQISYDLTAIRAEWLKSSIRDFDALKSEQLAKIDQIEIESWQAWERSKAVREITVTEATEGARPGRKAVMRKEAQVGDPRFLERILKCVEQRCQLLGLNAPQKVDLRLVIQQTAARVAEECGVTIEEVLAEAQTLLQGVPVGYLTAGPALSGP